jgi:hypothetical protein
MPADTVGPIVETVPRESLLLPLLNNGSFLPGVEPNVDDMKNLVLAIGNDCQKDVKNGRSSLTNEVVNEPTRDPASRERGICGKRFEFVKSLFCKPSV